MGRHCCLNKSRITDGDVNAFHHKIYYLAVTELERESLFWENVLLSSEICLSHSLSVVLSTTHLLFLGSCLVLCLFGLISLLVLLGLLGLLGFIGLLGKKEIHETHETRETHET